MLGYAPYAAGTCGLLAAAKWLFAPSPELESHARRKIDKDVDCKKRPGMKASCEKHAPRTGERYLVIGTGSVGLSLVEALTDRGETVTGFDMVPPRRSIPGVNFVQGSVTDYAAVKAACENVDVVFATFALIRYYERQAWQYGESHDVNVLGTSNVIRACIECGVKLLVQTSTSHVCLVPDLVTMEMDERTPLVTASNAPNHYGWTKVQAERAVLAANGQVLSKGGRLLTGCIRPCSAIFGPEDNFITERYLKSGCVQQLLSWAKIDYVYVENVVWAHLLLERGLRDKPQEVGGEAFCASNCEPVVADDYFRCLAHFWEAATGKSLIFQYLPYRLITGIAYMLEGFQWLTHIRVKGDAANLTGAMLKIGSISYAYSSEKAKRLLGYEPLYNLDEAVQRTVQLFLERNGVKAACSFRLQFSSLLPRPGWISQTFLSSCLHGCHSAVAHLHPLFSTKPGSSSGFMVEVAKQASDSVGAGSARAAEKGAWTTFALEVQRRADGRELSVLVEGHLRQHLWRNVFHFRFRARRLCLSLLRIYL
eukprot:gb/GFBE01023925.1/.p1 GENE.gb/GFBE01023925.1/~~gb/GFBE01023925.1/.p1  ORF type:complete len:538 (+),score=63.98 gb/GFBE01023925.1/:1-1614(+)